MFRTCGIMRVSVLSLYPGNFSVHDPNDSRFVETGFPSLQWEEEDLPTRPMPLHERPMQARIDHEMAIIAHHHVRIALAIEKFWGHRDCVASNPRFCQRLSIWSHCIKWNEKAIACVSG